MAKKSFGIAVLVGGTAIAELLDVNIGGVDINMIDVTSHDSDGWKEYLGGLKDGGTVDLSGNYLIADAGQVKLREDGGEEVAVVVTFSDNSTCSFDAIIGGYSLTNPLDDKIGFSCPLKVTGPLVFAAGA
jgi:predicted secreted protein